MPCPRWGGIAHLRAGLGLQASSTVAQVAYAVMTTGKPDDPAAGKPHQAAA
jgi:hypothetical protein